MIPRWRSCATRFSATAPGAMSAPIIARKKPTWPASTSSKAPAFKWEPELLEARREALRGSREEEQGSPDMPRQESQD